jgi:hypothetical protein
MFLEIVISSAGCLHAQAAPELTPRVNERLGRRLSAREPLSEAVKVVVYRIICPISSQGGQNRGRKGRWFCWRSAPAGGRKPKA